MTPERWHRIDALFHAAVALPAAERPGFLDSACGGDVELRDEVEALLRGERDAGARLDVSPGVLASALIDEPAPAAAGQHIGGYRLLRELGRGGMGVVFLAEREDLGNRVALKVLRDAFASAEQLGRFEREQRLLARLEHPHIARLLDAGVTDAGLTYFAMERVAGQPIDRYCEAQRLDVTARLRLFIDVCRAVDYAHRNLVIHRDLKPANVLVTDVDSTTDGGGQVKLLDFGIARALGPDTAEAEPLTGTGMFVMTPAYSSPEQLRGAALSTASDVYSLGVMLYELLTGRRPYALEGRSPAEIERALAGSELAPPSARVGEPRDTREAGAASDRRELAPAEAERLRRRLRGDLDTIVLEALRSDPERRYASAGLLADELERHLTGRPVQARPDTLRYRIGKFVGRHRASVAAGASIVLLLAAYAVTVTLQSRRIAHERTLAQRAAARASRISEFLIEMYDAGDPFAPEAEQIQTMRVPEFLRRQASQVLELEDQPAVQALLMRTVGRMYQSMGMPGEARPMLERAVAFHRSAQEPTELAESLTALGALEFRLDALDAAAALMREALELYRGAGDASGVAATLTDLGDVLRQKGDLDEARALLEQSLPQRRLEGGRPLAQTLNNLALVRRRQGALADAEAMFQQALALNRQSVGATHSSVAVNLANLALVQWEQGRLPEAVGSARASLALRRQTLGSAHWRTGNVLVTLSQLLHDQDRLEEAEGALREGISIFRGQYGETHAETLRARRHLADLLASRGADAEATRVCHELLNHYRQSEPDHPGVATLQLTLAGVLQRQGRLAEAEALVASALASRGARYAADDWRVAEATSMRATLLASRGDFTAAEPLLLASQTALVKRWPGPSRYSRRSRSRLASLYEAWGRPDQAAAYRD